MSLSNQSKKEAFILICGHVLGMEIKEKDYRRFLQNPLVQETLGHWGVPLDNFNNAQQAFAAFKKWYGDPDTDRPLGGSVQIGITGADNIGFEYQLSFVISDQNGVKMADAHNAIRQARKLLQDHGIEPLHARMSHNDGMPHSSRDTETIEVTHLRVSHDGNKKRVKAIGGSYTKWGVPVYPEVLPEFDDLNPGEHVWEKRAYILLENGNPKKVLKWL